MTLIQVAGLANLIGLLLVLFVSTLLSVLVPHPVFARWLRAYWGVGGIVALEFIAIMVGRHWLLDMGVFAAATWATAHLIATGRNMHAMRDAYARWLPLLLAIALASTAMRLAGLPFATASLPLLLTYVGSYFYLSRQLATIPQSAPTANRWLIALPPGLLGAWMLVYPLMHEGPLYWVGFAVSSLLLLLVGIGMMSFLLAESTRQLREQNERLQDVDMLKSQLLSTVSHELRTPLTAIRGFMELLDDELLGPLNANQREAVEQSLSNAELLQQLIDSIVSAAYSETLALEVALEPVDLQACVRSAVQRVAPILGEKHIQVRYAMPAEACWVMADRLRLTQVLLNLIGNAVKFSERGGRLWLSVEPSANGVTCVVRDEGVGIPPGALENVFDPFFQVDSTSSRAQGGIGLGLTITKNLVSAMGGTIQVKSELGMGSSFGFTLHEAPSEASGAATE